MTLQQELGYPNPIESLTHEAVLAVVLTGQLLAKEAYAVLRRFGLTDSQFNVLMLLRYQTRDGSLSQTDLSRMLVVNRSNVTGLVDRLAQGGLVARLADSADRRVNRLRLTPAGEALLARAEDAYLGHLAAVMSGWSAADCRALSRRLRQIRSRLRFATRV